MEKHLVEVWTAALPTVLLMRGWLTSWLGQRIEVASLATAILAFSFWFAHKQNAALKEEYEEYKPKGREPDDPDKLKTKIAEIEAKKETFARQSARKAAAVGVFGFLVPSVVLGLGILIYPWFVSAGSALATAIGCGGRVAAHLDLVTTALFVSSQFLMGFGQHMDEIATHLPTLSSAASLTPTNSYIAFAMVVYRFFVSGFSLLFLNLLRRAWIAVKSIGPKEKKLREKLARVLDERRLAAAAMQIEPA